MNNAVAATLALLLTGTGARAQAVVDFLGDRFVRKHERIGDTARLIEFVPADETLEGWTRLVGYRAVLDSRQSAEQAATTVVRLAEKRHPGTLIRVLTKGSEAIAEFVINAPGGLVEFNAFKYGPGPGGRGLVSLQYARRVRGLEPADVRKLGEPWTAAVARSDLGGVRNALLQASQGRAGADPSL